MGFRCEIVHLLHEVRCKDDDTSFGDSLFFINDEVGTIFSGVSNLLFVFSGVNLPRIYKEVNMTTHKLTTFAFIIDNELVLEEISTLMESMLSTKQHPRL